MKTICTILAILLIIPIALSSILIAQNTKQN